MAKITRIATRGIAAEARDMKVGDVVRFPLDNYNYNSIRSAPNSTLMPDRISSGKRWKTKLDWEDRVVDLIRIA